jgi:hypothetical protein
MTSHSMAFLVASLLVAPVSAEAAGKGEAKAAAAQREALVDSLPRGKSFRSDGRAYRFVGGVRALRRPAQASTPDTLAKASVTSGDLLEDKGHFLVVRQPQAAASALGASVSGELESLPVAVNTRTKALGVVLGTLIVKLKPGADAAALAEDFGLKLESAAPHLSMAFFRVSAGTDIRAAALRLGHDARVKSAEIEVKEHFDVPM